MARPRAGYRLSNGRRVPGVTTITGRFSDKDALIGWAYNTGYQHAEDGMPKNRFAQVQEAADIGTYIHQLVQWHVEGRAAPEPLPDPQLDAEARARGMNGFQQFLDWMNLTRMNVTSWEEPLVSERYQFGGTPDGIFEFCDGDGGIAHIALGDWKSSKRLYYDTLMQLAAYLILWEENFPESQIDAGIQIVRFSKDAAVFDHKRIANGPLIEAAKRQFLRFREAYDDDQYLKQMFGG